MVHRPGYAPIIVVKNIGANAIYIGICDTVAERPPPLNVKFAQKRSPEKIT